MYNYGTGCSYNYGGYTGGYGYGITEQDVAITMVGILVDMAMAATHPLLMLLPHITMVGTTSPLFSSYLFS